MNVRVISSENDSSVIEWSDEEGLHRGTVPSSIIDNGTVVEGLLSLAIPFGIDWVFELEGTHRTVTANDLAQSLRKHGIWTAEDTKRNAQAVLGSILSAYGTNLQTIMRIADKYLYM